MHPTQRKLLELSQRYDLKKMGLRQIGRLIGVDHPQKIKFHLEKIAPQLGTPTKISKATKAQRATKENLLSIPIVGLANCGDATMVAEDRIEAMLLVSPKMVPAAHTDNLFAVQAVGASMNRADLNGKAIEDGDYVIIDGQDRSVKTGDYILSVIGGLANIKKYVEDETHRQVVLESESDQFFPPIYIHEEDLDDYIVSGKVIEVLKQPVTEELRYEPIMGEH